LINIIISGPCGVGKSAAAKRYALQTQMKYLDFDELRATDMERRKGEISPCSVSYLDLTKCLPPMLENISSNFVLDIGGDTVFRRTLTMMNG
jgi:hypothetical protein